MFPLYDVEEETGIHKGWKASKALIFILFAKAPTKASRVSSHLGVPGTTAQQKPDFIVPVFRWTILLGVVELAGLLQAV